LLTAEVRDDARDELDELYRAHLPQLSLREHYTGLRSGAIYRTFLNYIQPLYASYRLGLLFERDDIIVDQAPLIRSTESDRFDASIALERQFNRLWWAKIWIGPTDQGVLYGASVTRQLRENQKLSLAFHANQRATDSLLLESLNGRQDEVSLEWSTALQGQLLVQGKLDARRGAPAAAALRSNAPAFPGSPTSASRS
jgi:hypothetical protein